MSYPQISSIPFSVPVAKKPLQVSLLDIETESGLKFKRFSDGTDRQFKSVSAIKDKLSLFDKIGISEGMAERVLNKEGIYAPDAILFGYDTASEEWCIYGGRERYEIAYFNYIEKLKIEQDKILADWEQRGNVGKERGNFIDIAFDKLANRQSFNADVHCAEHSLHQEKPFTTDYLVDVCNDFVRLKTNYLDHLGSTLITQYVAHASLSEQIGNYGFATIGDLVILNRSRKEYFFFDVKADKDDKMYPAKSHFKTKSLEGQMSYFEDNLVNKYSFQVMCSYLAVLRTGGIWNGDEWIDLSSWTYRGGGIIHWSDKKRRFNVINLPAPTTEQFKLLKNQSGLFIRDYFLTLKAEKDARTRIPSVR